MAKLPFRRTLTAAAAAGLILSGSAAGGVAQPTARAASPVTIHFWFGPDDSGATQQIVSNFNKAEAGRIKVVFDVQARDTGTYFTNLKNALNNKATVPDVFAGDVIWPAQLAAANLILPVDKYFPKSQWKNYLDGPILDLQRNGHIYGAPWFTDFGLIYYRKDLLAKYHMETPTTWEAMQAEAKTLVQKGAVKEGFVFQGDQYEGLVCNALEFVNSAGGAIYGPKAKGTTAQAAKGLATMRSMITSGAAPKAVTAYQEETGSGPDFRNGQAAFVRNWPYLWALAQDKSKGSKVAGKVGVLPMLHEPGQTGYSTLGGWNLSINASSQHPNEAWTFIKYVSGFGAQKLKAIVSGQGMGMRAVYTDPTVLKANPWYTTVIPRLHILPRPTSPVYGDISLRMQRDFHGVLDGSMDPAAAVSDVESFTAAAEARFH